VRCQIIISQTTKDEKDFGAVIEHFGCGNFNCYLS